MPFQKANRTKPASTKRRRSTPEVRIAEIKLAARVEMAEKGYDNFLLTDVANRCGVSEATVYRYFETKRDLLVQMAEDWFQEVLAHPDFDGTSDQPKDLYGRLLHLLLVTLRGLLHEPALSRFAMENMRPHQAHYSKAIAAIEERFTHTLRRIVEDGVASGEMRPGVPLDLLRNIIAGGIEHSFLRSKEPIDAERTAIELVTLVNHGVSATALPVSTAIAPLLCDLEGDVQSVGVKLRQLKAIVDRKRRTSGSTHQS